jgi:hypothetical protein
MAAVFKRYAKFVKAISQCVLDHAHGFALCNVLEFHSADLGARVAELWRPALFAMPALCCSQVD